MPAHDERFSVLPPRFKRDVTVEWSNYLEGYSGLPEPSKAVAQMAIASVIYAMDKHDFLDKYIEGDDPYFTSRFHTQGAYSALRDKILAPCLMECPETGMVASGVPQSTINYIMAKRSDEKVCRLEKMAGLVEAKVSSMEEKLENVLTHISGGITYKHSCITCIHHHITHSCITYIQAATPYSSSSIFPPWTRTTGHYLPSCLL